MQLGRDSAAAQATAAQPIADYAIIGDCRSAALVGKEGAIDWLCWPRFDSASVFGGLLDPERAGSFVLRPAIPFEASRRYLPLSNVLETTFTTVSGEVRIVDLMPVFADEDQRRRLVPTRMLLRYVECVSGKVPLAVHYAPRFDYGNRIPRLYRRGESDIYCAHRGQALLLQTTASLKVADGSAQATVILHEGEAQSFALTFADSEPLTLFALADAPNAIAHSVRFWQSWAALCRYEGPYRDQVVRSALLLKLLTYAPSGAVIAAPTTSLPEKIGGVRNWDYRYCWLRDASMTLRAFLSLGYFEEGERFLSWLLHSTRLTWPELQVLYDVYGETRLRERTLSHLAGYAGSRPVRIGNDAKDQLQLEVYGEVLDAVFEYVRHTQRKLDRATARMLAGFGETVCQRWHEPDEGIWETRGGRRQHTFSKVLCWVALDRLIKLHDAGVLIIARDRFAAERATIEQAIETQGYSEPLQSYVTAFDGEEVDGSLLLLPYYGYSPVPARTRSTYRYLRARLAEGDLFYRFRADYRDGLPPGEGTSRHVVSGRPSAWHCMANPRLRAPTSRNCSRMPTMSASMLKRSTLTPARR